MSLKASLAGSVQLGGVNFSANFNREEETPIPLDETLTAAHYGTLTTRTDANDGELTLEVSHGVLQAEIIDIFWVDVNGNLMCAYGATVGVINGQVVPFVGAAGDALPAQDYVCTADVVHEYNIDFDGDDMVFIIALSEGDAYGNIRWVDVGPALLKTHKLLAREPFQWWTDCGHALPITGNPVDAILVSNGDKDNDMNFKFGVLYSSLVP